MSQKIHPNGSVSPLWLNLGSVAGIIIIIYGYVIDYFGRANQDIEFAILCTSMTIGSITAWGHYFVFLIFPLTVGFITVLQRKSIGYSLLFGIIVLIIMNVGIESALFSRHLWLNIIVNYIPLYATLIFLALLSKELIAPPSLPS